ncbi:MAG: hypothetical protein CMJ23_14100 [Phycisphaerae bacterium]|nr:hypothetical protein [Phycisphaerae bacterium]
MESPMLGTTTTVSEILLALQDCVHDGDFDAARFLQGILRQSIEEKSIWFTLEEELFLDSV